MIDRACPECGCSLYRTSSGPRVDLLHCPSCRGTYTAGAELLKQLSIVEEAP